MNKTLNNAGHCWEIQGTCIPEMEIKMSCELPSIDPANFQPLISPLIISGTQMNCNTNTYVLAVNEKDNWKEIDRRKRKHQGVKFIAY